MSEPIAPDELRRLMEEAAGGSTRTNFETVYGAARRARRIRTATAAVGIVLVVVVAIVVPAIVVSGNGGHGNVRPIASNSGEPTRPVLTQSSTDPLDLVGSWHVLAAGESPSTSLILGGALQPLSLFEPCGMYDGGWNADHHGLFIADIDGGDGSCFQNHPSAATITPPWLADAVGYRDDGANRLLLDANGDVIATLSPGAQPTTGPNDSPEFASPPAITPELRKEFQEPAPLPASAQAATPLDVLGRWQPLGATAGNPEAFVKFTSDGVWQSSDGCNGEGGRYAIGLDGQILTTSGASTSVGCNNSPVPNWVSQAGRVAVDGNQLAFYDPAGELLGRVQKD